LILFERITSPITQISEVFTKKKKKSQVLNPQKMFLPALPAVQELQKCS